LSVTLEQAKDWGNIMLTLYERDGLREEGGNEDA
jgi:hypothetical protein